MKIYSITDAKEVDRYQIACFFLHKEDAEETIKSFGDGSKNWELHEIEVIE